MVCDSVVGESRGNRKNIVDLLKTIFFVEQQFYNDVSGKPETVVVLF